MLSLLVAFVSLFTSTVFIADRGLVLRAALPEPNTTRGARPPLVALAVCFLASKGIKCQADHNCWKQHILLASHDLARGRGRGLNGGLPNSGDMQRRVGGTGALSLRIRQLDCFNLELALI